MKAQLSSRQLEKLRELCLTFGADLSLIAKAQLGTATSDEVDILCEVINDDFLVKGIDDDFEANDYGKEMELLLDAVNTVRLR